VYILDLWKANYQDFQEMFVNDYCLKILSIIFQKSQKKEYPCANDIAKILDIHISTATKYLNLLFKNKFIEKEQLINKPGKPTYYKTKSNSISINLDLAFITQTIQNLSDVTSLPNPLIREEPNLSPRVIYKFDDEDTVKSIVIKKNTKARRIVKREFILSKNESQFMKYLPHPTMKADSYIEICSRAGINDVFTIKEMYFFVKKLEKNGIIKKLNEG
jgi:predicted transcriptional regulator